MQFSQVDLHSIFLYISFYNLQALRVCLFKISNEFAYTRVTDATLSFASLKRMRRTPWGARPREGTDLRGSLMTWPFSEIMMTSFFTVSPVCLGSKTNPATISPVLAVTFAVLTPEPPRLCRR